MKYVGNVWKRVQHHLWTETMPWYGLYAVQYVFSSERLKHLWNSELFHYGSSKGICWRNFSPTWDIFQLTHFPTVYTKQKHNRGCVVILHNAGWQQSPILFCFLWSIAKLHATTSCLFLTANSHHWSVPSETVNAAVTLTSAGQITVVGCESSNCRDFSTTAYFST